MRAAVRCGMFAAESPARRAGEARPPGACERVAFMGDRGAFLVLVVRGSLMLIPTFGFYRFWLATEVRRHLWSATRIGADGLEWTGTGRELLTGFLIALALLTPLYLGYVLLGLVAESLQAFASVPLGLLLTLLGRYAEFRARRYRATRTALRGLRFWMTGSGLAYAARAVPWDLLTLLTLGLAYPWRAAALERYKMSHTHYGTLQGRFEGTGGVFFRRGRAAWAAGLLVPLAGALAVWASPGPYLAAVVVIVSVLVLAFAYPALVGIEARWRLEGVRFGPVALSSDLSPGQVVGCYWTLFGAVLAYLLVAGTLAGFVVYAARGALQGSAAGGPGAVGLGLMVLAYLGFLAGFRAVKRRYLHLVLWGAMASSVSVHGLGALDEVVARGRPAGSLGEGLADALDVGGF